MCGDPDHLPVRTTLTGDTWNVFAQPKVSITAIRGSAAAVDH
jgi:hypothetical protein